MSDLKSCICSDELRRKVEVNLSEFEVVTADEADLRRASVAIVLTEVGPGANIEGLKDIAGWSDQALSLIHI